MILTYHDFVPARNSSALWFDCTPVEFESQLDALRAKGFRFVRLADVERRISKRISIRMSVALTFADGYEGFYRYALPILRRRKIPGTMFVHTGFVGNRSGRPKMNWPQLVELDREGLVDIASQTVSHPVDLRMLSESKLRDEMVRSKATLEHVLGHAVTRIAYPNGKFDARVAKAAQAAGYTSAYTEELQPAERATSFWTIPRYVHTRWRQAIADVSG